METIFTKEYFITKFEAIPDKEIGRGTLENHCALHHCGVGVVNGEQTGNYHDGKNWIITPESTALIQLFGGDRETDFEMVYNINDGRNGHLSWGNTPKERILNKLKSL